MSIVDPAVLEQELAKEYARADRLAALNQANQRAFSQPRRAASPKADQYLSPPAPALPSTLSFDELKEKISSGLADYKQRESDLAKIRQSLRKAQEREAAAAQKVAQGR